jgi:hypothetical protein
MINLASGQRGIFEFFLHEALLLSQTLYRTEDVNNYFASNLNDYVDLCFSFVAFIVYFVYS